MTWLIRLYPPAWRRRYGRELTELIASSPASFSTAVDLIAGAVDAWFNPQPSTAVVAGDAKGAGAMVPRILKLRCAGYGPHVTAADTRKAAAVTIGGTLALVAAVMWATARIGKNPYLDSLLVMGWLVPFLVSQHYTTYKGRSARVQAVLIGVPAVIVVAIALAAAWINSHA
jgi:hypothetical protein